MEVDMDWMQYLGLIATMIAGYWYVYKEIRSDIKVQSARSDQLYTMFIDLLKQRNGG